MSRRGAQGGLQLAVSGDGAQILSRQMGQKAGGELGGRARIQRDGPADRHADAPARRGEDLDEDLGTHWPTGRDAHDERLCQAGVEEEFANDAHISLRREAGHAFGVGAPGQGFLVSERERANLGIVRRHKLAGCLLRFGRLGEKSRRQGEAQVARGLPERVTALL